MDLILTEELVDNALLGDERHSTYRVVQALDPDVICLGYDQIELGADLRVWMDKSGNKKPIHYLQAYNARLFHSSILHSNKG